VLPRT